ncbi:MAG: DUF554 domain-containing protein [Clostridia bacterium]|nr:DUF554 domain-containing protein [Clostridia bacterium]
MLGVWVNSIAVVLGGLVGTWLRGGIPDKYRNSINMSLALCVLVIGISGAITTQNMMLVILSLVIGTACGEAIGIENHLDHLGNWAQNRFAKGDNSFSQGFINATLLFCIGSMAVVGSLEAGLQNKPDTLLAKSALDGVSAIIFASSMGPGVILSVIPLTLYQGGIALLATFLGNFLPETAILEMSAAGSVMIIGLGVNMLGVMKDRIRVGNMLPALFIPALYILIQGLI